MTLLVRKYLICITVIWIKNLAQTLKVHFFLLPALEKVLENFALSDLLSLILRSTSCPVEAPAAPTLIASEKGIYLTSNETAQWITLEDLIM